MVRDHGPSIKDNETYEALRDEGYSKSTSARIANAEADPGRHPSQKGGKSPPYEDWTRDALYDRAAELNVEGRSGMTKHELIKSLRARR